MINWGKGNCEISGASRNFKTGKYNSGDCFDPPFYIRYVFVVRVEYEIHINCKHCMWTTIKVSIVMQSKFTKFTMY